MEQFFEVMAEICSLDIGGFINQNFVKNILPLRDLQALSGLRNGERFKKKWNFGDKTGKHPGLKFLFFCFDKINKEVL